MAKNTRQQKLAVSRDVAAIKWEYLVLRSDKFKAVWNRARSLFEENPALPPEAFLYYKYNPKLKENDPDYHNLTYVFYVAYWHYLTQKTRETASFNEYWESWPWPRRADQNNIKDYSKIIIEDIDDITNNFIHENKREPTIRELKSTLQKQLERSSLQFKYLMIPVWCTMDELREELSPILKDGRDNLHYLFPTAAKRFHKDAHIWALMIYDIIKEQDSDPQDGLTNKIEWKNLLNKVDKNRICEFLTHGLRSGVKFDRVDDGYIDEELSTLQAYNLRDYYYLATATIKKIESQTLFP